jgi:hypothetical protein
MSFLRLNGLEIPVADGTLSKEANEVGDRGRAFNGQMRSTRRALKDSWVGMTIRVAKSLAIVLRAVILGLGDVWPFDFEDTARLTADTFTGKGAGLSSGVAPLMFGIGADGARVVEFNGGVNESQFGSGSLVNSEVGYTNLLAANQRDVETDTTGFAAVGGGASIARVLTDKLQGAASLEVTAGAINEGMETTTISASAATAYLTQVYVKPSDTTSLTLFLIDDIGEIDSEPITVTAGMVGKWIKVWLSGTSAGGASNIKLQVLAAAATTFHVDALAIAQTTRTTSISFPDSFIDKGDPVYPIGEIANTDDITASLWVRADSTAVSIERQILLMCDDFTRRCFDINRHPTSPTTNAIRWITQDEDDVTDTLSHTGLWDGQWHHVVAIMRAKPAAGESKKELYVDGVLRDSSSPAKLPDPAIFADIRVGHQNSTQFWHQEHEGLIDELALFPYAAVAAQVTGWFNLGEALGVLPQLKADGDFIEKAQLIVEGELGSGPYQYFTDAEGTPHDDGQAVAFTLHEV